MRSTPETKLFAGGAGMGLALAIGGIVLVIYLAKKLGDVTDKISKAAGGAGDLATDVGSAVKGTGEFLGETLQSGRDLINAATTGNAPNDKNADDPAINYFESLHDLIFHPVDSFNTLMGK